MGLFDKLFARRASAEAKQAKATIREAWENSRKPQGAHEAATSGGQIRARFFTVVEDVEAKLDGPAIGVASAEGVLMVHPKLKEELCKQPDADVLEVAITHCFVTTDSRRRFNESWPSQVARYRGRANSGKMLHEKSSLLAAYVVNNLDTAETTEGETSDEQDCIVRLEEAAVWYRVLDELAYQLIHEHRAIFMDFLQNDLALNLALLGSSPDLIDRTIAERSGEYAEYRQWVPDENVGAKGTLLWEAAKHVGEQIGLNSNPVFLLQFGTQFIEKLNRASIHELLVGKAVA